MFRRKAKAQAATTPPSQGARLRDMALTVDPAALGLGREEVDEVWGVVMDTVFDDGEWYTLVTFAEGTTSLYTSGSFGGIGAGEHDAVRAAGQVLLDGVREQLSLFSDDSSTGLPAPGFVAIRAMTFSGRRVVTAVEADLGEGRHPASPVFYAAHEVITKVREADDAVRRR